MATNFNGLRLPEQHLAEHDSDPAGHQRGYIRGTDYSAPYTSQWSRLHTGESASLLRHLNCSYLSTHGHPPTLLSLKQHAQALCNLILMLVPTTRPGEIDPGDGWPSDPLTVQFRKNDAFDFLNDLRAPYTNDDPDHQLPLNSLVNEVRKRTDLGGTDYHCALATCSPPRARGEALRPYANHHNLLMHANACLERLDHEFGAEGGLMAVLPGDEGEHEDEGDKAAARNSLLGQWLSFTQHLVRRAHELEISYGNALDIVQADAVLPMQALSAAGPDGRSVGRQIAYPQDRWVLSNAGDDTYAYIQKLLDVREAVDQEKEMMWRDQGVSGERQWRATKSGQAAARGIVAVNVGTRYYRLAGKGHGTVFVVPGWDGNPAVDYTKLLEKKPGVVGVPVAKWPERVSEIEKRVGSIEKEERSHEMENTRQREEVLRGLAERESLQSEMERVRAELQVLEEYMGEESTYLAREVARLRDINESGYKALEMHKSRYERAQRDMSEMRKQYELLQKDVAKVQDRWSQVQDELRRSKSPSGQEEPEVV
ncbi:hypothetical protein NKR19_g3656 [Coniochaeta hoffmannii]|uniref:Uncharacterized protein n=1 Tax=Coniochaeta hoffmannii TaxID=91930 RepID=A0AA38S3A4_9PEZI|nr:hypothetical protein NKR19_g3656 [Coniochaeta hoffmannii]